VLLGLLTGVGVFIFGRDAGWLFALTKADPAIVPYARDFLAAMTWGAPATCAFAALIQHRQAMGDSRSPMILQLTGNVFHGFLGYALIYGKLGLPALGPRGAGYATSITEVLLFLSLGTLAFRDGKKYLVPALRRLRSATFEVLETGLPTGLQFAIEVFAFTAFTAILGSIASTEIAAHQIALNVIRASFLPGIAVSEAACVLVGQSIGRGESEKVPRIARSALRLGMGFMAFCGLCFALFGERIARAFTDDPDVIRVATRLLFIAAAFQVLDAVSIVLRGVLRGAKDATFVAICGVAVALLTIPTFAYVLGKQMGMGAVGGWLGFIAETTLNASILYWRLRRTRFEVSRAPTTGDEPKREEQAAEAA
jgi:MATE family multidrug resistance protein